MDEARPLLAELRGVYAGLETALSGWTCDASTDCCRFGVTGREPYVTSVELLELERAVRARGGLPKRRSLPVASERRCALLGDDGRCLVYTARPLGCRTFYCARGTGPVGERAPAGLPTATITAAVQRIADIASRLDRVDPQRAGGPRPLSRATSDWRK